MELAVYAPLPALIYTNELDRTGLEEILVNSRLAERKN
jgi:hypothetical protein